MASLHPSHGARAVLEREERDGAPVRYRVAIYEPSSLHTSAAELDAAGGFHLGAWQGEPPAWAVTFVERVLAGLAKKHAADASWPRKITRWREPRG
jgi:hypothetical protein